MLKKPSNIGWRVYHLEVKKFLEELETYAGTIDRMASYYEAVKGRLNTARAYFNSGATGLAHNSEYAYFFSECLSYLNSAEMLMQTFGIIKPDLKDVELYKKSVLDYVYTHKNTPLTFKSDNPIPDPTENLKACVLCILGLSSLLASIDESGFTETSAGRYRSSLDLWRHVRSISKDITIFQVMKVLSELSVEGKIYGHYCPTVCRQVFKVQRASSNFNVNIYKNEYGIPFWAWSCLEQN